MWNFSHISWLCALPQASLPPSLRLHNPIVQNLHPPACSHCYQRDDDNDKNYEDSCYIGNNSVDDPGVDDDGCGNVIDIYNDEVGSYFDESTINCYRGSKDGNLVSSVVSWG